MIPLGNLPDYVERGGQQVWRMPASARQVELYGFVIRADKSAIDALLLRDLVLPSGGAVDYRCAHENVVVTFGNIGREASLDPVDKLRGFIREREVSVWCLTADVNATGRLVWYLPYIFTDSEQTIATGRETYGYPKQLGYFDDDYPDALGPKGGVTAVSGLSIDPFGPDEEATVRSMLSIARKPGAGKLPAQPTLLDDVQQFFPDGLSVDPSLHSGRGPRTSTAITPADAPPPPYRTPVAPWIKGVLDAMQGKTLTGNPSDLLLDMINNPTLVFLKQFRDASCATKACYQAVIEAPIAFDPAGAGYQILDPRLFELTVQSWASDPIAAELGIAAGEPIVPALAFHASFGFDIQLGLEVWRAPT